MLHISPRHHVINLQYTITNMSHLWATPALVSVQRDSRSPRIIYLNALLITCWAVARGMFDFKFLFLVIRLSYESSCLPALSNGCFPARMKGRCIVLDLVAEGAQIYGFGALNVRVIMSIGRFDLSCLQSRTRKPPP